MGSDNLFQNFFYGGQIIQVLFIYKCKKCRDKIKSYINRLSNRAKKSTEKTKELLKLKAKDRAKFYLRQAKLHNAQIKTYEGQLDMMENQIRQIESAKNLRMYERFKKWK